MDLLYYVVMTSRLYDYVLCELDGLKKQRWRCGGRECMCSKNSLESLGQ